MNKISHNACARILPQTQLRFFCFARNCFSRNTTTEDKIAIGVMLFISRPCAYSRLLAYIHTCFIAVSVLRVHFAFYVLQLAQRHCIVVCYRCPSVPDCQQGSSITTSSAIAEKLFSAPLSDTDLDLDAMHSGPNPGASPCLDQTRTRANPNSDRDLRINLVLDIALALDRDLDLDLDLNHDFDLDLDLNLKSYSGPNFFPDSHPDSHRIHIRTRIRPGLHPGLYCDPYSNPCCQWTPNRA